MHAGMIKGLDTLSFEDSCDLGSRSLCSQPLSLCAASALEVVRVAVQSLNLGVGALLAPLFSLEGS